MSGAASERRAVKRATDIQILLDRAAKHYKFKANVLVFCIRFIVFSVVLLTLIQTELEGIAEEADTLQFAVSFFNNISRTGTGETITVEQLRAATDAAS